MPRFFNTASPNEPSRHYTLPVTGRLPDVRKLIEQQLYFTLHAPHRVGKTTSLLHLGRELTAEGRYVSLLVSMDVRASSPRDLGTAELAILAQWRADAAPRRSGVRERDHQPRRPGHHRDPRLSQASPSASSARR